MFSSNTSALCTESLQFGFWWFTGQGAQLVSSALQEPRPLLLLNLLLSFTGHLSP